MEAIASITTNNEGKTYEVPESCVGKAQDARETITQLINAEEIRSKRRAKFKGMLNGNPPWPRLLRDKGQAERANFTQREAEGFMAGAKTPYYSLAFKSPRFISLTLEYGNAEPALLAEWANKIATRYQYTLEDWDGLDLDMQHSQFQMVAFGSGPMMWEDDEDWRSSSRDAGQLMLPDDASADIDKWDTAAVRRSYLPTTLWKLVQNEKAADGRGWNVPAVQKAIMHAAPEDFQSRFGEVWETYETEMRKGNTGWNSKSKRIFVADLFQKEFTGKISHFIILQTPSGSPDTPNTEAENASKDPKAGFLFRKIGRFKTFRRIVCPFIYDVGPDKQWHSVKGAGPKIFDFCSASDRLFCRGLDGAMKASGVIVQAKDGKALNEEAFTDVAGGTVVGSGYNLQQTQRVAPNFESPLLMKRELGYVLSRNTGQYRAHFQEEPAPTLGQQQMTAQEQNVLQDGDSSRYCKQLDAFHLETFRRMLLMGQKLFKRTKGLPPDKSGEESERCPSEEGALKFFRSCVQLDGIPPEILDIKNFCRVKATRIVGNGSTQMRQIIGNQLMQMLPMAPERGRNFILRNQVSSIADDTYADAIFPAYDTPQMADSHMSIATLENNALKLPGAEVMRAPENDDAVHFDIHLKSLGKHAALVQAGQADPHALLIHAEQAGPHMFEHMGAIANDPTRKQQVKAMQQAWMQLAKSTDQLKQQVEAADAAAAAQQEAPKQDPAIVKAMMEVQANYALEKQDMEFKHALKAKDQQFKMSQKDITTAHDIRLKNFTAQESARTPAAV